MSFKAVIIMPNRLTYSQLDLKLSRFTLDKLLDDLEDNIKMIDISGGCLTDTIIDVLDMHLVNDETNTYEATTSIIYQDDKVIYELCHIIDDVSKKQDVSQNNISMRLTDTLFRVTGKSLLLKSNITTTNNIITSIPTNISIDDVIKLFRYKIVHQCVKINSDGNVDNIEYILNPLDWLNDDKIRDNYKYHEIRFADKIMLFFVQLKHDGKLNEKATLLVNKQVYGDVIVAMRTETNDIRFSEYVYYDITSDMLTKLVAMFSVPEGTDRKSVV